MYPAKQYDPLIRSANEEDKKWLFDRLKQFGEFTGITWLLCPEPNKESTLPIPAVKDIILSKDFIESGLQTGHVPEKLKVTETEIKAVVEATVNQTVMQGICNEKGV